MHKYMKTKNNLSFNSSPPYCLSKYLTQMAGNLEHQLLVEKDVGPKAKLYKSYCVNVSIHCSSMLHFSIGFHD